MLRVARRTREVAGLLPGASIFGDLGVQAVQIILRILMACQITVCDRRDIERLGIIRDIGQDGLGKCQPPLEGVGLQRLLRVLQRLVTPIHPVSSLLLVQMAEASLKLRPRHKYDRCSGSVAEGGFRAHRQRPIGYDARAIVIKIARNLSPLVKQVCPVNLEPPLIVGYARR